MYVKFMIQKQQETHQTKNREELNKKAFTYYSRFSSYTKYTYIYYNTHVYCI